MRNKTSVRLFLGAVAVMVGTAAGLVRGQANDWQYLLVTSQAMEATGVFQPLLDFRAAQSLNVHLVTVEGITTGYAGRDAAEKVRACIRDGWLNHGTRYVLLGGDGSVVPARLCRVEIPFGGETFAGDIPCDLYFGSLEGTWDGDADDVFGEPEDGVSYVPDVAVGRIPAADAAGAGRLVAKILAYENEPAPPFAALLAGECLWNGWGGEYLDQVGEVMAGIAMTTLDDRAGFWSPRELLRDYLNSGDYPLVHHAGPGSTGSALKLTTADLATLANPAPFFLYSEAEFAGDFTGGAGFGQALLTEIPAGAFGAMMHAGDSWLQLPDGASPAAALHRAFMEAVFWDGRTRLGDALVRMRELVAAQMADGIYRWSAYGLNLLGCPATRLHWDCPAAGLEVAARTPAAGFVAALGQPVEFLVELHTLCAGEASGGSVTVTVPGGAVLPLRDDGAGGDDAAGDGIFTGAWTPAAAGPATLLLHGAADGFSPVNREIAGQVRATTHYYPRVRPFQWEEIAHDSLGFRGVNDYIQEVALGFAFPFYGQSYDAVTVSSNGNLLFAGTPIADRYNSPIPDVGLPNAFVACYWTDLEFLSRGDVYAQTLGAAPERRFVVQWNRVSRLGLPGEGTFQAVLEEGTGLIRINYLDTDFGNIGADFGADAVCGVEDQSGTTGTQYSCYQSLLVSRTSVEFRPGPPAFPAVESAWWGVGNREGRVLPGDAAIVWVRLRNESPLPVISLTAHLAADPEIGIITGDAVLASPLAPNATADLPFQVSVPANHPCGGPVDFHLSLNFTDDFGQAWAREDGFVLRPGWPDSGDVFVDDMESGPGEWTAQLDAGAVPWQLVDGVAHGGSHSWFVPGEEGVKDAMLVSPVRTIPEAGGLEFYHRWDLEDGFDGAVVEMRLAGGEWMNLTDFLVQDEYNGEIAAGYDNPLAGSAAWTGSPHGADFARVRVDLSQFAGQAAQFRFRLGGDVSNASAGWYVDDVRLCGRLYDCTFRPGDVTGDGAVDALDLTVVLNYLAGNIAYREAPFSYPERGDLTRDGPVDAADLAELAAHLAGSL